MVLGFCFFGSSGFNFPNLYLARAENQYHFRLLYKPTKLIQNAEQDRSRTFLVRANGKVISSHSPRECLVITDGTCRSKKSGYRGVCGSR